MNFDYTHFLNTPSKNKWENLGLKRRAGVVIPLFSVRSSKSTGIGEIMDLKYVIQWCKKTGLSIIQLLPLNEVGFDFAPYNCISSFALEPMYLSLYALKDVNLALHKKSIRKLKKDFRLSSDKKIDYRIKQQKLEVLWDIFKTNYVSGSKKFLNFKKKNEYWLEDYAIYKVLKEQHNGKSWEDWEDDFKKRKEESLQAFQKVHMKKIEFYKWLQWQLYEQLRKIKRYAVRNNVLIMGDIPYLVARDSADTWTYKNFFKLEFSAGAPPDMYFAFGQRWGSPPYNRIALESDGFTYLKNKLKYAENFYHLFRIDHFVGLFRLWTIDINSPDERKGLDGFFDPADENIWEETGLKILRPMFESTEMMPVAEDLGIVPECSYKVLWEYGIPGINVQRWTKDQNYEYNFLAPEFYRINSVSTLSTHDSSSLVEWWHTEAGTIDKKMFETYCISKGFDKLQIESLLSNLFDQEKSNAFRLYWNSSVDSIEKLLMIVGRLWGEVWELVNAYRETYKEKEKFLVYIGYDIDSETSNTMFFKNALKKNLETASVFCINLLQEWLCLDENFLRIMLHKPHRINYPGVINDENWTTVIPFSLEKIQALKINQEIKELVLESKRL
jgi:4-alpha-glucanotransferase